MRLYCQIRSPQIIYLISLPLWLPYNKDASLGEGASNDVSAPNKVSASQDVAKLLNEIKSSVLSASRTSTYH